MACFNPLLAEKRKRKREVLLTATEKELTRIQAEVRRRTRKRLAREEIALKVGRVLHRYQMAKHLRLKIGDGVFSWERKQASIDAEAALDGIYVERTSEPRHLLSAENTVRSYKRLADVEQAFRSLKNLDLLVRPIHHRLAQRVRAHLFLCLLAYHVQYHMTLVAAGAVILALGAFNAWSIYALRKDIGERSTNLDARMAKVGTRLDAMAKAQQAQQPRRGPDPDKVYPVRYDGAPARGVTGAPIVIAEFSDFQ